MIRYLAVFFISLLCWLAPAEAAAFVVRGVVADSDSGNPVSYATVEGIGHGGTQADEHGAFKLKISVKPDSLRFSALGYSPLVIAYADFVGNGCKASLLPTGVRLTELVVKPKKEKYSKKNNPAVDFVNKIRHSKQLTDPRQKDNYNYNKYERITIALNNVSPESNKNLILKKFDFLRDHIDTSEVSKKPILSLSTREKLSEIHYRREPHSEKEIVKAMRQEGLDDFMDQGNMTTLYEDFFKNIDLYKNDIDLLHNRMVSPLSKIGPDFYKYYLTDTVMVDSVRCIELSFVPHTSASFGFTGRIYVPEGDTTMFIKKVVMNVPKEINLNFIEGIYINQEFVKAPNGSRLLVKDDLVTEVAIMPGAQGVYFRRNTVYTDHNFDEYADAKLFEKLGSSIYDADAYGRDLTYWNENRPVELTRGERSIGALTRGLRSNKVYYWSEKFLSLMVHGYVHTGADSKVDLGPVNTLVSHNTLEGFRFRLGGITTANLSKRLFARGYVAYGTDDKKYKYSGELEYSFNDKKYHSREFPIHSLKLTHSYDVNMLGQDFAFTNPDNMFLSFKRHEDYQINYLRTTSFDYTLELANNFSVVASLKHERQEESRYMKFITSGGQHYSHYNQTSFNVKLRFSPGEKVYQQVSQRIRINEDSPAFILSHTYSPKGFMGSMFELNCTEMSITKRFWFSAFGYLDAVVKGGHLWSSAPYPNLLIPNANLSYTIQPESFALMNPMEFVTDSYASWDLTYWANGAIFNYIPYFKKLKLREAFAFRGVWGHLSKKNNPEYNGSLFMFPDINHTRLLSNKPYMEASVGVDNIFKILRLDYVWRLSYRTGPDIDTSGLRLALHFTF